MSQEPEDRSGYSKWGTIRELPSGRWQAKHPDPTAPKGKRRYITAPHTFVAEAQARDWLTIQQASILTGTWEHPAVKAEKQAAEAAQKAKQTLTVEEWANQWLDLLRANEVSPNTIRTYRNKINKWVLPYFGHKTLASLTKQDIQDWYDLIVTDHTVNGEKRAGTSRQHRKNIYIALGSCMRVAVEKEKIDSTPCQVKGIGARMPRKRKRIPPIPEPEQINELISHCHQEIKIAVLLAYHCGLRYEEIAGLERQHVNLQSDPPVIHIVGTMARDENGRIVPNLSLIHI